MEQISTNLTGLLFCLLSLYSNAHFMGKIRIDSTGAYLSPNPYTLEALYSYSRYYSCFKFLLKI